MEEALTARSTDYTVLVYSSFFPFSFRCIPYFDMFGTRGRRQELHRPMSLLY